MFQGYRSSDAVITICQVNDTETVEIRDLNREAQDALGYSKEEVENKPLVEFLPERIGQLLTEYVEFENEGNDVGNVLSKVQSFCIFNKHKNEVSYKLKVLRSESLDKNMYFRLILQDKAGIRKDEAFREMLQENFKGHEVLDEATGLPDRNSITKDVELVHFYVNKEAIRASLAVLEVDNYEKILDKQGQEKCTALIKHIAHLAKQNLRTDDTIGFINPGRIAIILMDTNQESARMVLNRLRWLIAATPCPLEGKKTLAATVSIAFCQVGHQDKETDILEIAEACLRVNKKPDGNALLEIPD